MGKILILKTLIVSRLVYTAHIIHCQISVIKKIDKLMFDFLRGSPAVRVKKVLCYARYISRWFKYDKVETSFQQHKNKVDLQIY